MSIAWRLYRGIAPILGALAPHMGAFAPARERASWAERMGKVSLAGGCDAWIHAASLGEATAVQPLLAALERRHPKARLHLTATTYTGRTRLAALGRSCSLAPIDSPQATKQFFRGTQPERVFLLETELWPHWLLRARAEQVPVAVVSARLSHRSVGRYRSLGKEFRGLVSGLAAVLCQGERDRERWCMLGARPERTRVVGNLKNDGLPQPSPDRTAAKQKLGVDDSRPMLVLGCVRPGEARQLAQAWLQLPLTIRSTWQVVAVPRHPRAAAELRQEAAAAGVAAVGIGEARQGWHWDPRTGVLIDWYRAAEVAFVGGSLGPYGGHNPFEPAACGAAVVMGRYHVNQMAAVRALERQEAIWVVSGVAGLLEAWTALLGSTSQRAERAAAALEVVQSQRGAADRAATQLAQWGLWQA